MNELELNGLGRPTPPDKLVNSVTGRKDVRPPSTAPAQDTVELSDLPDISALEAAVEKDFVVKRSGLEGKLGSAYPPLETVDRVAAMLAGALAPSSGNSES